MDDEIEPCGVMVVLEYDRGNEAVTRWCDRTDGPCPYPGARPERDSDRLCGAGPVKRLQVRWAPACIDRALVSLTAYCDGDTTTAPPRQSDDLAVAIDALRACGAGEPEVTP